MTILLLTVMAFAMVKGNEIEMKDIMNKALDEMKCRIEQNKRYEFMAPCDMNDKGTTDDRDKPLDDKIALREMWKIPYEVFLKETNYSNLSPEQQEKVKSYLYSRPAFQIMTKLCKELTKSTPVCNKTCPYRTFDGTCNNLENPTWGSVLECTRRMFPPHYTNVNGFRLAVSGKRLPNPRKLSLKIHKHMNNPNYIACHMLMFYGQFVDHDIAKSAASSANGINLQCCSAVKNPHPQCAPIMIGKNDPFYKNFNKTCINFARNAICSSCDLSQRNQMNTATSHIDCSHVYGVTKEKADELRAMDGTGKLKTQSYPHGDLLPPDLKKGDDCGDFSKRQYCFNAGDPRVNEHSPIMCMHTVFLRFHNNMCDGLKQQNPKWDDEKLYQEARKILIAVFQHITYHEYLVFIIGKELMDKYHFWAKNGAERIQYNPKVDPTMKTEFSTSAYRLHSIIGHEVSAYLRNGKKLLKEQYSDAVPIYHEKGIERYLSGIIKTPSQKQDKSLVIDVTDFLYRQKNAAYGLDLAAINIHRGRDHGLPPYIIIIKFCFGKEIKSFDDLLELMIPKNVELLKSAYKNVADVDAWVGMQTETPLNDAIVGPTAACIITEGFYSWKFGDRFFYENPHHFSDYQLLEIKKMYLSAVICQVTSLKEIHKHAFLCPIEGVNPLLPCSEAPKIDLSKWKEASDS